MKNDVKQFVLRNRIIDSKSPCYVIAEVGINHNGDVELAKKIIDVAYDAKADAVKFQKRTLDLVYTEEYLNDYRESPFGTTQRALKEGLEFNTEQYLELKDYAHSLNLDFIVSPWDEDAVDFICDIGVDCIKIASPCLHDINLLKHIREKEIPVILSTGMSDEEQIDLAVEILKDIPMILLHCVSIYPPSIEDLNLSNINLLKTKYPFANEVGYSGHEMDIIPVVMAVAMGAKVIEKHVTLSRQLWGSDQKVSLEPDELKELVVSIRNVEKTVGSPKLEVLKSEIPTMKKLQRKRKINLVVIDIDGVITDGRLYCNEVTSVETKSINYKDLDTISAFRRKGYEICIITKEDSDMNKKIIEKFKPDYYITNCENKYNAVLQICEKFKEKIENVCYIGDSYPDVQLFKKLKYTFCPNDAIKQIKDKALLVLNRKAGEGCLSELIEIVENINKGLIM